MENGVQGAVLPQAETTERMHADEVQHPEPGADDDMAGITAEFEEEDMDVRDVVML